MSSYIAKVVRHVGYFRYLPLYWWFQKLKFGVTNTKFDISWSVFRSSFVQDQYNIRRFLDATKQADTLFFFDIGRNHGFVFYYTMYHILRSGFRTSVVNYVGIDPAPLKFVYFNDFKGLRDRKIKVNYFLLDKAVAFSDNSHVKLKYGERNFGNFNIDESNFAEKLASRQRSYSYVEIDVETIGVQALKDIVGRHKSSDAMIVKIDCKNQTTRLFLEMLDTLGDVERPYLLACERDSSGDRDVSSYAKPGHNTLTTSNVFKGNRSADSLRAREGAR